MSEESIRIGPIASIIIPVADQDRAIAFYVGELGMEKRADVPFGEGDRWVEVAPRGQASGIALSRRRPGMPETNPTCITFVVDDVDAMHAAMKARGIDVDPEIMRAPPPVPPMFFFRDPDGNALLIAARG